MPELIVAIVILGIIMVPLTASFIVGLTTTTDAEERLSESRSTLFTSAFFANDVQSIDPGGVTVGGTIACGTNSGTNVVTFRWADDVSPTNVASYVVEGSGTDRKMVRRFCRGSSLVSSSTVAPVLAAADPTVTCTPDCANPRRVTLAASLPSGRDFSVTGTRRTS